jgi:hypothetical protein
MIKSVTEWEPKLRQAADKWMNELSEAVDNNGGQPVTWNYKNLQDRFRQFAGSHIEILETLRNAFFIIVTQTGNRRQFNLTDFGRTHLVNENYSKLRLLLTDQIARERNREAIAKRKINRKIYADPTKQIIDDFRHGVKFEHKGLLKQLRKDRDTPRRISRKAIKINGELKTHAKTPIANIRFQYVLQPLLAFETRKFCKLEKINWKIFHEFLLLPFHYRRFASFKGKPYIGFMSIKECQPKFAGSLPCELFPAFYAFGENLGWTLVYENDGVSIFADRNDKEFSTKLETLKAFIREQLAENSTTQTL